MRAASWRCTSSSIENGMVYIVMEYLAGPALEQEMRRPDPLPAARVAQVADRMLQGLWERCTVCSHCPGCKTGQHPAGLRRAGRAHRLRFRASTEWERPITPCASSRWTAGHRNNSAGGLRLGSYTDLFCPGATLYHARRPRPWTVYSRRIRPCGRRSRMA